MTLPVVKWIHRKLHKKMCGKEKVVASALDDKSRFRNKYVPIPKPVRIHPNFEFLQTNAIPKS